MKLAVLKAAIVLVPCYIVAYLTEQMVYVVPTLAAAGIFATSVGSSDGTIQRNVDDDAEDGDGTNSISDADA